MIDFACKRFDIKEIVKCALGLTAAEMRLFDFFLKYSIRSYKTDDLCKRLDLKLTTIQKGVKKLHEKGIIKRKQINLDYGGYFYIYETNEKVFIRKILKNIIKSWSNKVEEEIENI